MTDKKRADVDDLLDFLGQAMPLDIPVALKRLESDLIIALCIPLAHDDMAIEIIRTGLSLARDLDRTQCLASFNLLAQLPPGPLRAWWLRAAYDVPNLIPEMAGAVISFLPNHDRALELVKKASHTLRSLDYKSCQGILILVELMAKSDALLAVDLFLNTPEHLRLIPSAHRPKVLETAKQLSEHPRSASGLMRVAGAVIGQAGYLGFADWFEDGINQPATAWDAFFDLQSPASVKSLNRVAGGLSLTQAAQTLNLYSQALTGYKWDIKPLSDFPKESIISPFACGGRLEKSLYLPQRLKGPDPMGSYRAAIAILISSQMATMDFLLSFKDPWLAADLWSLANEWRTGNRLKKMYPGLVKCIRDLNSLRHDMESVTHLMLHPALRRAAGLLWGREHDNHDSEIIETASRLVHILKHTIDIEEAVRRAYEQAAGAMVERMWRQDRLNQSHPLKFGSVQQNIYATGPKPKSIITDKVGHLSRTSGRNEFAESITTLSHRMRSGNKKTPNGTKIFTYPEWDHRLRDYKLDWVTVTTSVSPFADHDEEGRPILAEGLINRVRRKFQRLRPKGLDRLKRQASGQEVDIQAAMDWLVDRGRGVAGDDLVYVNRRLNRRDAACALLIDLSGSTGQSIGPAGQSILETARQGIWVLAEALNTLGDSFGLFGFSGSGRGQVDFSLFKNFEEPWNRAIQNRLRSISPDRQNRDGAAIRHTTYLLNEHPFRRKIMIILSDGKPDDYDYTGLYAMEDTKAALAEARQSGISVFCITIDHGARDYMASMMGHTAYCILDDIGRLPEFLPNIYGRLIR